MRVLLIASTEVRNLVPGYLKHVDTAHADELAEQAGRLCYESWDRPNPQTATNQGYLANIIQQGHFSVLEHASATFYIDGVTRNFTHELIRHRHLSFSEVSQRYVDAGRFPFVHHPGLVGLEETQQRLLNINSRAAQRAYGILVDALQARGRDRKAARQAARHVLPGGTETKILVTGNHRAWREMLDKRLAPAADAEFRAVAALILGELRAIAPNVYQDIGHAYG
jgi:thymidylate synthase (FAD)